MDKTNKRELIKRLAEIDKGLSAQSSILPVVFEDDKIIIYVKGVARAESDSLMEYFRTWRTNYDDNQKMILKKEKCELEGLLYELLSIEISKMNSE